MCTYCLWSCACRWLPQSCSFLALYGSSPHSSTGSLLLFQPAGTAKQPSAAANLTLQHTSSPASGQAGSTTVQPCCMELLSTSGGTTAMLTACCSKSANRSMQQQKSTSGGHKQQVVAVAVGFTDGSSRVYQLDTLWCHMVCGDKEGTQSLQLLLESCT